MLVYGHYDVQPPDPLEEWLSPPFEPAERNGNLYARGAVDDKGQVMVQVKALESLLAAEGKLPMNVRVLFEGEEEVGGEGIAQFVASKPKELKADFALVSDTELFAPGLPTLCVGLRGTIYTELEVRGARSDLHSGMYGGAAPNSFVALAQILAKLKDDDGHILIPGFYDELSLRAPRSWRRGTVCRLTRSSTELPKWARSNWWASRDTACWNGPGRGRRWMCTACPVVHGRRREDGDSGQGDGEGFHAAGSGDDAGQGICALQELCGGDCATWSGPGGEADPLGRSVPDSGQ